MASEARSRTIILFCSVAILTTAQAEAQLAQLKLEKPSGALKNYRLYVRGRKTPVVLQASTNAIRTPSVEAHLTRSGVIYGTVQNVESGAYTVSVETAFVSDKGAFTSKNGYYAKAHRDEAILLVPEQDGPWIAEGKALLYEGGKILDIGLAHDAGFGRQGRVVGWYYSQEDGTPYGGLPAYMYNVSKQYFEYRNGIRTLKGKVATG